MKQPSFNVLTEPWIPVIRSDGAREELGIVPCLKQTHELREIRDPAPIIEFGLYRLLVAFVLDAMILAGRRPEDALDLQEIIKQRCFDSQMIDDYAKGCGDVFDLFHPERPFLQTPMPKAKPKPLAGLLPVAPSGTNVSLWHHDPETAMSATAEVASRLLTTIAPFMTAGGAGLSPSINGSPAIYVLPTGDSLFETIVLNIPCRRNLDSGDGVAAWQSTRDPGGERVQATTVEALTWRPRRIQLLPEVADGNRINVRQMRFEKGDSTRLDWIDSNLAYRYGKDKPKPVRMREGRPMWRDAGPLLLLNPAEYGRGDNKISFRRPDVVEQAFAIAGAEEPLVVNAYGMRTDLKMKVFEWAKSTFFIPAGLGRSTRLGSLVQRELDLADSAARLLRMAVLGLSPEFGREERKPPGKRKAWEKRSVRRLADRCERAYWQRLEPHFQPLMNAFAALEPDAPDDPDLIKTTAHDWRESIRRIAIEQFELAAKDMDADSAALERQVLARNKLYNVLRKVLT